MPGIKPGSFVISGLDLPHQGFYITVTFDKQRNSFYGQLQYLTINSTALPHLKIFREIHKNYVKFQLMVVKK